MVRSTLKKIIDSYISFECKLTKKEAHEKKRVLILRKDTLGDYILFYPSLMAYRKAFQDAEITLVVTNLFEGLLPLITQFENVIWYDAKQFSSNFFYRRNFLRGLKKKGFDVAIQTTYSREPAGDFMIRITEAEERIGVKGDLTASTREELEENNRIYTQLVTIPDSVVTELDKNKHIAEAITRQHVTITFPTIDSSLFNADNANTILTNLELTDRKYVIFFPGSGTTFKIWPREKFSQIADYFVEKGITPVLCGSSSERGLIDDIIKNMKKGEYVNISGKTDLGTMVHLLKSSVFYFGSDNGIMHLAVAVGVPALGILGGGHFRRFFPYGDMTKNRIIFFEKMKCKNDNWECSRNLLPDESAPCIAHISVEHVKREIDSFLLSL